LVDVTSSNTCQIKSFHAFDKLDKDAALISNISQA